MAYFTISQLGPVVSSYTLKNSDLVMATIGTDTYNLSSARITLSQIGDYMTSTYANAYSFTVVGALSAARGLSANGGIENTIKLHSLPTSSSGLTTGDLFTQTVLQLTGAGGSTKVLCVA